MPCTGPPPPPDSYIDEVTQDVLDYLWREYAVLPRILDKPNFVEKQRPEAIIKLREGIKAVLTQHTYEGF